MEEDRWTIIILVTVLPSFRLSVLKIEQYFSKVRRTIITGRFFYILFPSLRNLSKHKQSIFCHPFIVLLSFFYVYSYIFINIIEFYSNSLINLIPTVILDLIVKTIICNKGYYIY